MIKYGIIQGGDPVTKDPAARAKYGTGGLNLLKPEISDEKHTRGAVSATQIPGKPDSAGTQFFISVTDQPGTRRPLHDLRARQRGHSGRPENLRDGRG